jgi:hypothetical protein
MIWDIGAPESLTVLASISPRNHPSRVTLQVRGLHGGALVNLRGSVTISSTPKEQPGDKYSCLRNHLDTDFY